MKIFLMPLIYIFSALSCNKSTNNNRLENAVIVCDGNSLTFGFGSSGPATKSYPFVLRQKLSTISGISVFNKGVSAQTTQDMISDAATEIDVLYNASKKCILIAWEIGNDLYFNGNVNDAKIRFQSYCQARRSAGFKVLCIGLPYRDHSIVNSGTTPFGDSDIQYNEKRNQINEWLRLNYQNFSDSFFDIDSDARFSQYNNLYFNSDRVHFNDNGYQVIAEEVKSKIILL